MNDLDEYFMLHSYYPFAIDSKSDNTENVNKDINSHKQKEDKNGDIHYSGQTIQN